MAERVDGFPLEENSFEKARARFDPQWIVIGLCVALTIYVAVIPLGFLLWQSFFTPRTASKAAEFRLDTYTPAHGSAETLRLFWSSLKFAFGAALFSFVLGTALAWMNERTNTPFKALFFGLSLIPLVIPSILFTVSWILLASPKIGIINLALQGWFNTDTVFVNIYSMTGMIWVDGLHYSPMAFLLMTAAFHLHLMIAVVLPFLVLVWSSLQKFYSVPTVAALKTLTFDAYRTVLDNPSLGRAVWNSLLLSLGSATVIMLLTSVICWIVV